MIPGISLLIGRAGSVGGFYAIASPAAVSGGGTAGPITSGSSSISITGGTAPFTYLWQRVSGDPSISADTGTASSSTFTANLFGGDFSSGTWRCKVTDAGAVVTYSNNVYISLHATTS